MISDVAITALNKNLNANPANIFGLKFPKESDSNNSMIVWFQWMNYLTKSYAKNHKVLSISNLLISRYLSIIICYKYEQWIEGI